MLFFTSRNALCSSCVSVFFVLLRVRKLSLSSLLLSDNFMFPFFSFCFIFIFAFILDEKIFSHHSNEVLWSLNNSKFYGFPFFLALFFVFFIVFACKLFSVCRQSLVVFVGCVIHVISFLPCCCCCCWYESFFG